MMRVPHRVAFAAVCLAVLPLVLAGCLQPLPEHPEEGSHEVAPPEGVGHVGLDVERMNVTWHPPPEREGGEPREMVWETEHAEWRDGIFTIRAVQPSDEGRDFDFTLRFRVDGPHPVQLAYNETLERQNSFNFTYEESNFWAGRSIGRVASVSDASWLDVLAWERAGGDVGGRFHLDFTGACETECPVDGEGEEHRVILDGAFPTSHRR